MARSKGLTPSLCLAIVLALTQSAAADLGSMGKLTVGVAVSGGFQVDGRGCDTAGTSRTVPSTGACILFAGGTELSLLWRGHLGAAMGVFGVSGQAAYIPEGQSGAAFPDRVSVPLLFDFRPFSFLLPEGQTGYYSRFLHGLRFAIGPSVEIVRTASDSSLAWGQRIDSPAKALVGMHAVLDGEVPLSGSVSGLSLRLSMRILYVPLVVLNDGAVQSSPVPTTDQTPMQVGTSFQGYASHVQIYLGLVYYL